MSREQNAMTPTYIERLKHHPGVPIATAFTVFGFLFGGVGAGIAASTVWMPVLWTARDQPVPKQEVE